MKYLFLLLSMLVGCFAHALRFNYFQMLNAGDMSQSSISSYGVDINQTTSFSIQALISGSPVGTLTIYRSNDNVPSGPSGDPAANVVNWTPYSDSVTAINGAGSFSFNVFNASYRWVKVVYSKTSGTGSLTLNFTGKD